MLNQISKHTEVFFKGFDLAILGQPAIEALKVVEKVNEVEAKDFKAEFPKLFKGLGKLDGPDYVIKLKPDANLMHSVLRGESQCHSFHK